MGKRLSVETKLYGLFVKTAIPCLWSSELHVSQRRVYVCVWKCCNLISWVWGVPNTTPTQDIWPVVRMLFLYVEMSVARVAWRLLVCLRAERKEPAWKVSLAGIYLSTCSRLTYVRNSSLVLRLRRHLFYFWSQLSPVHVRPIETFFFFSRCFVYW